jgi:hypothetical protein
MRIRSTAAGDRGAPKESPPSHPRNSLSPECELGEVKPDGWGWEGGGDQHHHCPEVGMCVWVVPGTFSESPGNRVRARGKEHGASVRVNFLTELSNGALRGRACRCGGVQAKMGS